MAINTISYDTKSDIETSSVPNNNKVSANDLNEIKQVVNQNANLVGDGDNLIGASNIIDYLMSRTYGKILWTNPNPNSSFESQNITLSSSDYDMLEIYYYDWVDTNSFKDLMCQKTVKGHSTKLQMQLTHNDKSYAGNRRILYINDTTLQVNNNYRIIDSSSFNTTSFNNWNVPVFIIGYKTGIFE